ncbi:hypothetical protein GCM10022243_64290 [Saccharothrix violaceirubra]|uniref:Gp6-like head-tail connector protein n=1 Tax=Saccharothrix violaceirubra TaxID=413306 RepID=A0A7W7T9K5_9PSEU|nr:hypothetical protein [Saccharothrix violaceirubra]MBB4969088.1 hypothetical protein [Saccharothrix violaceirubra]
MRVYATTADLVEYAGEAAVDDDSPRLLARASEEVDALLVAAVYPVDAQGYPVEQGTRDAVRRATCAVVEWWGETGDPVGAGAQFSEAALGTLRFKRADTGAPPDIGPRAARILATAGLLAHTPLAPDRWGLPGKP